MKEFVVHKCRFLDIVPSAIVSISACSNEELLLLGRENGNLELLNIKKNFALEKVIYTNHHFRKAALLKSNHSYNALTTGIDGVLNIYSLDHLNKISQSQLPSPVWDLKVLESSMEHSDTLLCSHNGILMSYENGNCAIIFTPIDVTALSSFELSFCPSITLKGPKARTTAVNYYFLDAHTIVVIAGSMDGSLYQWEVRLPDFGEDEYFKTYTSASLVSDLPPSSIPWTIEPYTFVNDENEIARHFVLGDSNGSITIWDSNMGIQMQSLYHHRADVLQCCLMNNNTLYSMGVDTSIVQYKRHANQSEWTYLSFVRPHTNDILSGTVCGKYLFSGGIDTKLCIHNIEDPSKDHCLLPFFKSSQELKLVREHGSNLRELVCANIGTSLQLWRLGKYITYEEEDGQEEQLIMEKSFLMEIKSKHQISSFSISEEAQAIAYSDSDRTRLLFLKRIQESKDIAYKIDRTIKLPFASVQITFGSNIFIRTLSSPNGHTIQIYKWNEEEFFLEHTIQHTSLIHTIRISKNGKWIVFSDLDHNIHIYNMETRSVHFSIPRFESATIALEIGGDNDDLLFIALSSYHIWVYHMESRELTEWSSSNTEPLKQLLDKKIKDPLVGLSVSPYELDQFIIYGHSWMVPVKMTLKDALTKRNAKIIKTYSPLFVDYVSSDTLAVVERPWVYVLQRLPNPFYRKRYGT